MVEKEVGFGLGFPVDTVHFTGGTADTVDTRWIMTGQSLIRKSSQDQAEPPWFATAAAVTDVRKFTLGVPHLCTWETVQLYEDNRNIDYFKHVAHDCNTYYAKKRSEGAPHGRAVEASTRKVSHTQRALVLGGGVWPHANIEPCTWKDCIRCVYAEGNRCLFPSCGKVACVDCSCGILGGYLEILGNGKIEMTLEKRGIRTRTLTRENFICWFRICDEHRNTVDFEEVLVRHEEEVETMTRADDGLNSQWVAEATALHRPKFFPFVMHAPHISAEVQQGTFMYRRLRESTGPLCVLRSLADAGATNGLGGSVGPKLEAFQALYEGYKKKINLSPALNKEAWSDITAYACRVLRCFGFHRGADLQKVLATSFRDHEHEESVLHLDHQVFCEGFLSATVERGEYDLCFLTNPFDVMKSDAPPEFYSVPMEQGDVYLLVGPWANTYPHAAIPREGSTSLDRRVVLIGGSFPTVGRNMVKYDVPGLERFYHYTQDENGLQHRLPSNGITGASAREALDRRPTCRAFGCGASLQPGENVVTCRVCRQRAHAFVPQRNGLERYENEHSRPPKQCSFNVRVDGVDLHECFQCRMFIDTEIGLGTVPARIVIGMPCCTCNKFCAGDTVCHHCKLYVHDGDGKCSKMVQLLVPADSSSPGIEHTMCNVCAKVATRKASKSSNPAPGIVTLSGDSMTLRSSPTKGRQQSQQSKEAEATETQEELERKRTHSKRKPDGAPSDGQEIVPVLSIIFF